MISIVESEDLLYDVTDYDVILLGVNILNSYGNGFQYQVLKNFRRVYDLHTSGRYMDKTRLGSVSVSVGDPIFCLCYISGGRFRPDRVPDAVNYDALEKCLILIKENFSGKRIASTIMGVSPYEGGGDKERILTLFNDILKDEDVTLYDYEQPDKKTGNYLDYMKLRGKLNRKEIGIDEYLEEKKRLLWGQRFGELSKMPEGKSVNEIKKIIKEDISRRKEDASNSL